VPRCSSRYRATFRIRAVALIWWAGAVLCSKALQGLAAPRRVTRSWTPPSPLARNAAARVLLSSIGNAGCEGPTHRGAQGPTRCMLVHRPVTGCPCECDAWVPCLSLCARMIQEVSPGIHSLLPAPTPSLEAPRHGNVFSCSALSKMSGSNRNGRNQSAEYRGSQDAPIIPSLLVQKTCPSQVVKGSNVS